MSKSRHQELSVRSYATTHPPGCFLLPTEPGWDQLVFADSGAFTAHADDQIWAVPPHRAICVPDQRRVRIETSRRVAIRCLYTRSSLGLFDGVLRVMSLNPLTTELVRHAIECAPMDLAKDANAALLALLGDQIAQSPSVPLQLPMPFDEQARSLAAAIVSSPELSLTAQIERLGASRRTLERKFREETQMSLGQWRRRARLHAAVAPLTEGQSVASVASSIGYSSASSFIAAFRSELGTSPRSFVRSENPRVDQS